MESQLVIKCKCKVSSVRKLHAIIAHRESGGKTPCILNLHTTQKGMISSHASLLMLRDRASGTHWIGASLCPRARPDVVMKRKLPLVIQHMVIFL
jgi:hypothetical protein